MDNVKENTDNDILSENIEVSKDYKESKVIALAGNPNVGKSTVFNALTGMNQHTGNWPGKTVSNAKGRYNYKDQEFTLVDIPGTYSIMSSSEEEEIARDFICFGNPDVTVVVADATCLERNLNLVLQILEVTQNVVLCINLMDEARKKKLEIDLNKLSKEIGVPVVGASARSGEGLNELKEEIYKVAFKECDITATKTDYSQEIENAISDLITSVEEHTHGKIDARWVSIKLLDIDDTLNNSLSNYIGYDLLQDENITKKIEANIKNFELLGLDKELIKDKIVESIVRRSESIYNKCVHIQDKQYNERDRKIDRILTSKATGIPIMILLLALIFWITIAGANYPSDIIAAGLFYIQDKLTLFCHYIGAPEWVNGLFVLGMYRTLAWVVSVMLPPMAIFFPLFTLLEDLGYLPRIAFNMDKFFRKACAHGKQALTMCMGFGCNACGVIGCRIIDSKRERLIAIITNNFVPCNGRFPTLIAIITMFFAGCIEGPTGFLISALILTAVIVFGVIMTLLISKLLSKTLLKGVPSSFALELPPYRRPQIGKVIVRSIFDRTLFVLGRAVVVAAPAGLVIWLMANINIGNTSILLHCSNFLDPFARLIGLDGVILMAFILGFPANEIVIPIIIMSYMCTGSIMEFESLNELHALLVANGWTVITAICTMLFSLMHFPCGTTCLTIRKETNSLKWTAVSFLIPTLCGIVICFIVANVLRLFI